MNILISQSQGETFAALSLQLLLPNTHTHKSEPPPFSFCGLLLELALFLWQRVCFCLHMCVPRKTMLMFYSRWEGSGVNIDNSIIGIHSVFLQMLIAACVCACLCKWSLFKLPPQCFFAYPSQGAPVQRSRSLSPAGSIGFGSERRKEAEERIRDLEELLQLKVITCQCIQINIMS